MRGRGSSIAGNPVLIGAATVLVIIVAMFLSYNANAGLPFVPSYQLTLESPSAANLVRGNEVRIGGARVGAVDSIKAKRLENDTSVALIGLKLERDVKPLPKDSTVIIRPKSALGLKYVEITRGRSDQGFEDGDTIPLAASRPTPVEFDEFTSMFNDDTRTAIQGNIQGFGDAFAGRGESINTALGVLPALLQDIQPVAKNLASPRTHLRRFFNELGDAARIVAPAAESQASLFVNLDTTFTALDEVAKPFIQDSITEGVPALDQAIKSFPHQRPFLRNSELLFHELRPGASALRVAAPDLADTFENGTGTLKRSPAFNRRLASLLQELQRFANDPVVPLGVKRLAETLETLNPTLQHLAPAQLSCNYITLWFRNVSSLLSEGDVHGTWQRFIIIATPQGLNNEGTPSSGARQRPGLQLPALRPVPEHGRAGPDEGVRGGQRAVADRAQGDRQRARQAAEQDGGHEVMAVAARRRRSGRSPVTVGLISLAIVLVAVWLGFTKDIPFTHGFRLNAVFETSNGLRVNSPVRIAGVQVGKVKAIKPKEGTDQALVVMEINKNGLPLHEDATAKIRPRIFLEGNFFVDLTSGSAGSPELGNGDTLKVTRTAAPVQLDQVLTSLQSDTRQDLRDLLNALGTGLNSKPTAAEDAAADPSTRGETAAQAWNDSYKYGPTALRGASQVNEGLLGTEPSRDVARLLAGTAKTTGALIRNEGLLKDLITNFNTTMGAFASEQDNLSTSIGLLPGTLENANATLASLNRAFPPTRAFAREILPGVNESAATIDASFPWVRETRKLLSQAELRGLAEDLAPTTKSLAQLTDASLKLLPEINDTARCARDVVLPTGDIVVQDSFANGEPNYKEFWQAMVGLAGESQNFDGNGSYVRFQVGGGTNTVALGAQGSTTGKLVGSAPQPVLGVRPKYPGKRPPYNASVPCYKSKIPNVNGPAGAGGPGEGTP